MNILTIDDNPADAGILRRKLAKIELHDYQLSHALDGDSGLRMLGQHEYECVLVDFNLGAEDGVEVIARIREAGHQLAVVACTGEGSETVAVRAMQAGADDYIVKGAMTPTSLSKTLANATERASLNRRIKEQQAELASFVGVVAHDLSAPLRHITSFTDLLMEEAPQLSESCRTYLAHIQAAGLRMHDMFDALLDYTRTGRGDTAHKHLALTDVLSEVVEDLQAMVCERNATIDIGTLPIVLGDRVGLRQLFQNLLGNGLKYNTSACPHIKVSATQTDAHWRVAVTDNGIGIPPAQIGQIFEPLRRLHDVTEYSGIGLGLATVKKIVEQHQACVEVASEPGRGSTFTVLFPLPLETSN